MFSKVCTLGYLGLDIYSVDAEIDVHRGLPAISIVGLVDTSVRESRDRIRSAIKNSGFKFPSERITINLAPANIKKEGTHFDLPIALGILAATFQSNMDYSAYSILGELSLKGDVREVRGVFPMALRAKEENKKIIVPIANAQEAALVKGLEVYPVKSLTEAVSFLSGGIKIDQFKVDWDVIFGNNQDYSFDFSEVKGQVVAKRALEIVSAGMHNILLIGPPGVGKTMLARRLPAILPNMEFEEILEITKIYSVAGLLSAKNPIIKQRTYRSPHHTSSNIALIGGGTNIKPGEVTLAHHGVLFLDELPEFTRGSLEALRQPLEDGFVNIARINRQATFPSRFLFIGAMNPCPCGYYGSKTKNCNCGSLQIQKYRNKISGPLLDRIDVHIELANIETKDLLSNDFLSESSQEIKKRVEKVRLIQKDRFKKEKIFFNSQMGPKQIRKFCSLNTETKDILETAIKYFNFSARAYDKILKVSRTIADLAESDEIKTEHLSEAIQYRALDKVFI